MPLVIDGYNLLRSCGFVSASVGPGELERARGMLLGLLAQVYPLEERSGITVVFDSSMRMPSLPDYSMQNGIHVHFATGHRDADEMIIELIQRHSAPKSLLVVSSDHQIQIAARRRRARFMDSDRWYDDIIESNKSKPDVQATAAELKVELQIRRKHADVASSPEERHRWMDEFTSTAILHESVPEEPETDVESPASELQIRPQLASNELKHGDFVGLDDEDFLSDVDDSFLAAELNLELSDRRQRDQPPRSTSSRALDSTLPAPDKAPVEGGTPAERKPPAEDKAEPAPAKSHPASTANPANDSKSPPKANPANPANPDPAPVSKFVSGEEIRRWERQLKDTDTAIFPPGYGEDAIFSESFEIDERLKKKRNRRK